MDTIDAERRHRNMSHIRSTGNALETSLRSQLFRFGYRFRKNDRRLAGSPDIVFPHYRAVVFVNGCFWHAHGWNAGASFVSVPAQDGPAAYAQGCSKFRMPSTNTGFWTAKFERNRSRDLRDISQLLSEGWRVCVVWECSITGRNRRAKVHDVASRISLWLEEGQGEPFLEV